MPSNNLPALSGGLFPTKAHRRGSKALEELEANTGLELAQVGAAEAVEIAKMVVLETVGHVGLASAGSLTAHRRQVIEGDPTALGCANFITETTVRAIGNRIELLNRRLG
ncbi:MAG: hypothetical protein ABSG93_12045 [Solirubrobacteraceae bacterium]|jgi:hypothetical protein